MEKARPNLPAPEPVSSQKFQFHFAIFLLSLGAFGIFALWVLISSIQGMVGFDSFMSVVVSIIAIVLALVLVGGVGVIYGRINFLLYKAASSSDSIVIRFFCALLFIVILVAAGIFGTLSTPDEAAWLSVVVWTHVISGILSAFFGMTFPNKSK